MYKKLNKQETKYVILKPVGMNYEPQAGVNNLKKAKKLYKELGVNTSVILIKVISEDER